MAETAQADWVHHHGGCEYWQRDGWFVQQLANGFWICGPNPAEPGAWTSAELLYVSREDAMHACGRRAAAAAQRTTEKSSAVESKSQNPQTLGEH